MLPLKLTPTGKDYLWGGNRLKKEYNKHINLSPLAESWECSVHPDGLSIVSNGAFQGRTLADVLRDHPEFLGSKSSDTELPILVKFIDAEKDLSVQVHPDDEYAREHEQDNGKAEMWYVLDADPGATLIHGFAHNVTGEQLREAVSSRELSEHLQKIPVQKDDVFFIPPGTVHGIGERILIAEIQQSSNATYRVYDYDRVDTHGGKRPLHFEKAIQVMYMQKSARIRQNQRMIRYYPGWAREILCRCRYFETERILISTKMRLPPLASSFQVLLCIEGEGILEDSFEEESLPIRKGDCFFLPSSDPDEGYYQIVGKLAALKVRC